MYAQRAMGVTFTRRQAFYLPAAALARAASRLRFEEVRRIAALGVVQLWNLCGFGYVGGHSGGLPVRRICALALSGERR
jgi:hypothetical protein